MCVTASESRLLSRCGAMSLFPDCAQQSSQLHEACHIGAWRRWWARPSEAVIQSRCHIHSRERASDNLCAPVAPPTRLHGRLVHFHTCDRRSFRHHHTRTREARQIEVGKGKERREWLHSLKPYGLATRDLVMCMGNERVFHNVDVVRVNMSWNVPMRVRRSRSIIYADPSTAVGCLPWRSMRWMNSAFGHTLLYGNKPPNTLRVSS